GQITAALPEGMELIIPDSGPDAPAKVQPSAGTAERSVIWSMDRLPTRVELAWRPYRPDLPVQAVADVTLSGRQAMVKQHLRLQFAHAPPRQVVLAVPASITDRLRLTQGGQLETGGVVQLTAPVGREHTLELVYSFPLPDHAEGGEDLRNEDG